MNLYQKKKMRKFAVVFSSVALGTLLLLSVIYMGVESFSDREEGSSMVTDKSLFRQYLVFPSKIGGALTGQVISSPEEYALFEDAVRSSPLLSELPSDAEILVRFYNFDSGEREWERSYLLQKDSFTEGTSETPDFVLLLHSDYLSQGQGDLCAVVRQAKAAGDLGAYSDQSSAKLLWKYKALLDYRECVGF